MYMYMLNLWLPRSSDDISDGLWQLARDSRSLVEPANSVYGRGGDIGIPLNSLKMVVIAGFVHA